MKTLKKSLVAILAALIMMISCSFTAFSSDNRDLKVSANGTSKLYYFYNYYPSAYHLSLTTRYNDIIYDYHDVDASSLTSLVQSYYFDQYDAGTAVVIDIKNFVPNAGTLYDLFKYLHDDKGCLTMLVTTCSKLDIIENYDKGEELFEQYIDAFSQSDYGRLKKFIRNSLRHSSSYEDTGVPNVEPIRNLKNTCILIDGGCIKNVNDYTYGANYLCESNPFLRYLLEGIAEIEDGPIIDYQECLDFFSGPTHDINIHLLVHIGNNRYLDIYDGVVYGPANIEEILADLNCATVFGIGFSYLDDVFNEYLEGQQSSIDDLYVYVMEVEPIVYGDSGATIISEVDFAAIYNDAEWNEMLDVAALLLDLQHTNR